MAHRSDDGYGKVCTICKVYYALDNFYSNPNGYGYRGKCKSCYKAEGAARARERGYRASPEARQRARLRYEAENKEKQAERRHNWYIRNKESVNARRRQRYVKDPEVSRRYVNKRRALKAGASGSFNNIQWETLLALCGFSCLRCGSSDNLTIDHVVPLSLGGSNDIGNIQPLCRSCNAWKYTKTIDYRKCLI